MLVTSRYGRTSTKGRLVPVGVKGGATGDRGTVRFARGYAYELQKAATDLLADRVVAARLVLPPLGIAVLASSRASEPPFITLSDTTE